MRKLAVLFTLIAAILAGPVAAAHASAFLPPGNKVFWGGQGGYNQSFIKDFANQSGKHPAIYNYFISWRASFSDIHWLGFRLDDAKAQKSRVLLSVSPAGTGLTPGSISKGKGDGFLVRLNGLVAERGEVTYVRPMSEMNNANNPYSAYDQNGRSRGPAYSTKAFKQAWRRLALILRGGDVATIDKKLKKLHLPAVKVGAATLPKAPIALAWVPLSLGNPEVAHNRPGNWWPGGKYVDWVGTTWYSPFRESSVMHNFYNSRPWRKKPFMFAEWGVWGADVPSFVHQFFGFLKGHKRVRAALYYQSASLKPEFRLSSHPKSRAALRGAVKWSRLSGLAPEFAGG